MFLVQRPWIVKTANYKPGDNEGIGDDIGDIVVQDVVVYDDDDNNEEPADRAEGDDGVDDRVDEDGASNDGVDKADDGDDQAAEDDDVENAIREGKWLTYSELMMDSFPAKSKVI